jgi:hypothetical protein
LCHLVRPRHTPKRVVRCQRWTRLIWSSWRISWACIILQEVGRASSPQLSMQSCRKPWPNTKRSRNYKKRSHKLRMNAWYRSARNLQKVGGDSVYVNLQRTCSCHWGQDTQTSKDEHKGVLIKTCCVHTCGKLTHFSLTNKDYFLASCPWPSLPPATLVQGDAPEPGAAPDEVSGCCCSTCTNAPDEASGCCCSTCTNYSLLKPVSWQSH